MKNKVVHFTDSCTCKMDKRYYGKKLVPYVPKTITVNGIKIDIKF